MSEVTTAEFNEEGKYLRKVRSFVLREGRLTKGQAQAMEQQWPVMGLDYSPEPLDLVKVFGRQADTVLEIGFGMGASLVEMAKAAPELNFIGIQVPGRPRSDAADRCPQTHRSACCRWRGAAAWPQRRSPHHQTDLG